VLPDPRGRRGSSAGDAFVAAPRAGVRRGGCAAMSQVTVRIPMPLRAYTQGAGEVQVQAGTVREALLAAGQAHEHLLARVLEPEGELRHFVNVFVGSRDVRS